MVTMNSIETLARNGGVVVDEAGEKIGKIGQLYLDDATGNPQWVTVQTGFFGNSESFAPLDQATVEGEQVRVPYSKDKVKDAPRVDADGHITPDEEEQLYRYYGIGVGTDAVAGTGQPDTAGLGGDTAGLGDQGRTGTGEYADGRGAADDGHAMTRSEEQVHVGTEKEVTGRARLRKYVVTEDVTTTVPVQREEVRVEREPITDANRDEALSGPDLTEDEAAVTLSEERVVVDKETVPVEQVRLDTETVTEQKQVSEEVRKEQIEADLPEGERGAGRDRDGRA